MWKHLDHRNILPFIGVILPGFDAENNPTPLQLVSPWVPNMDMRNYIKNNVKSGTDIDRLRIVGVPLVVALVAPRLLQSPAIRPGQGSFLPPLLRRDSWGPQGSTCFPERYFTTHVLTPGQRNILIDDSDHALLADFGLAKIVQNLDPTQDTTRTGGPTPAYTAPEVYQKENFKKGNRSKPGDVFAFAMVMIEVRHGRSIVHRALAHCYSVPVQAFTGKDPSFDGAETPEAIRTAIQQGQRPIQPTTLTGDLWELTQRCWDKDPEARPLISEVDNRLAELQTAQSRSRSLV